MHKPHLISKLIKATPTLLVGSALLFYSFSAKHPSAIAQPLTIIEEAPTEASSFDSSNGLTTDLSELTGTYFRRPRNSRSRSRSRTTTATRQGSCLSESDTTFAILGPDVEVGQTSATHPSFVWYLPEAEEPYPLTFRLLEPNEKGIPTAIHTAELDYSAGFMKYQLPDSLSALSPGKEYRWQVVITCNPNYPSQDLLQELSFEVVRPAAELSQALSSATTEADTALAYGQSGLWYEAIAQVALPATSASLSVRTGLLQNLSELEVDNENNPRFSEDIASIAEATAR